MAIASVLQPVRSMDSEHCRWHIPPPNFHQPHRPRFLRACLVPLPFHSTFPPSPPSSWQYAPPAALRSQTVVSVDEGKVKRQLIVCSTGFTPNVDVEFSRTFPLPPILGSCFLLISIECTVYIYNSTSNKPPSTTAYSKLRASSKTHCGAAFTTLWASISWHFLAKWNTRYGWNPTWIDPIHSTTRVQFGV